MTEKWVCPQCKKEFSYEKPDELSQIIFDHGAKGCVEVLTKIFNLTEVLPKEVIEGNFLTMDDAIDHLLLVKDFSLKESAFKEDTQYLSLTVEVDGEDYMLNTGAERIVQVFKQLPHEKLPVYVTFEKVMTKAGRRVYRIKI